MTTLLTRETPSTPDGEPTAAPSVFRRPRVLAAAGTAVALLVGGSAAWAATEKDVTLVVDGQPREVSTHSGDVDGVLAQAGIDVGEHDLLAPGEDAPVEDGSEIVLRRARELTLAVDGEQRTVWVTATNVDEALDQVGVADDRAFVSADRSRRIPLEGLSVEVRTPKTVTITDAAGDPLTLETTAADLAGLLAEVPTFIGPEDEISAPLETAPVEGQQISITRIASGTRQEVAQVPAGEVRREDGSMYSGETKVVDGGRPGEVVKDVAWKHVNGQEVEARVVAETVTRQPSPRVVAVGTKARPAPVRAASSSSGSSSGSSGGGAPTGAWAKVAQCESGGNPRATNPSGKYRGLYQFSRATWASVGGSGDPAAASVAEQTKRAQMLLARSGAGQWPECGRYLR